MHPELVSLLETARYAFDDDTPRLIVADWLEEHGDESGQARAEWVRLGVAVDRLVGSPGQRNELSDKASDWQGRYHEEWFSPIQSFPGVTSIQHERGMVCPHLMPEALDHLDELFAGPDSGWIEGARCWGWARDTIRRLLRSPHVARLASLGLGDCAEDDLLPPLLAAKKLDRLRHLLIISGQLTNAGLAQLLGTGRFGGLVKLCLLGNRIGRDGVRALTDGGLPPRLASLDLSQNQIGPQGIQTLARAGGLERLRLLELGWNRMGDRGLIALAQTGTLVAIERLELSSNDIGSAGVEALAEAALPRIRSLDLSFNQVRDAGLTALAGAPFLASLHALDVRYNQIGEPGLRALLDSPHLGRLQRLTLNGNTVPTALKRRLKRRFGEAVDY